MIRRVGVPNAMFSKLPLLREALLSAYPDAKLNASEAVLDEDELIRFLGDCDAAIIGLEPVTDRVLRALPNLRIISKFGVGVETVDFEAIRKHGIRFGYKSGVNKLSVAELTLCFAICALRGISTVNQSMRAGRRPRANLGRLLTGRIVGIHGCGHIGKEVVRLLRPFACEILTCDIKNYADFYRENGVMPVSFDELVARSEVLSLHLPLTNNTRGLYSGAILDRLKPDCVLINTCRGGIVDEIALRERLESGRLTAACFDVFAVEPVTDDRLLQLPNFLATPHIGASALEARLAMAQAAIDGLSENALVEPGAFSAS